MYEDPRAYNPATRRREVDNLWLEAFAQRLNS